ncbi:MAG: DUF3089 domain-containing protein [Syntrophomonas sp.]|nr:DUF3089 domain-containing protein [Syntrophomonas sp.]
MKNRIKISIFVVVLLAVAAVVSYAAINGGNLYAEPQNWAYIGVGKNKQADLFIICPTVYIGDESTFNMSLDDTKTKESFLGALNMERGIYEDRCRIYAPYYRQAALNVYTLDEASSEQYFEIAYSDVKDAFTYYMKNYNDDRPIVLAGFSQGADMALRLMKDYFGEDKYKDQLVAAYIVGWRVTENDLVEYPFLKMAQGETDTGVIVSFNSEAVDVDYSIIVPESTFSINPLNWKTDSTSAGKELNLGACFTDYSGQIATEIPQLTGAYIDPGRGTLKITDVSSQDYPPVLDIFKDGVYHLYDYQFFYKNLQENVKTRVESYFE